MNVDNKDEFLDSLNGEQLIEFERLFNENKYLRKLFRVSHQLSTSDLMSLLKLIINSIVDITGVNRGFLMLIKNRKKLSFKTIVCTNEDQVDDNTLLISKSIAASVIKTGKPELIRDVDHDPEYNRKESILKLNVKWVLCVPLKVRKKILGVIYVDSDHFINYFTDKDLYLFEAFASQAAIAIEHARLFDRLKKENIFLKKEIEGPYRFGEIICQSENMKHILQMLQHVLENTVTVLIQGETGTGKELIARAIHYNSTRKKQRFIAQNCAALPASLLESELFGYKKGAFTGATEDKAGLFESANGGTIFLDEIGDTSPDLQVRLLRVLENRTIRRIGETKDRKVDVRVISATHRNLKKMVAEGSFREDLYYRLNVFPIKLPPLRDRKEDIPLLINHFIKIFNKSLNKNVEYMSKNLMDSLMEKAWKGNIRELKNYIYRAMIMVPADEKELHINKGSSSPNKAAQVSNNQQYKSLQDVEKAYIEKVLTESGFNQTLAAKRLGVKRSTLYYKMQKLNISFDKKNKKLISD